MQPKWAEQEELPISRTAASGGPVLAITQDNSPHLWFAEEVAVLTGILEKLSASFSAQSHSPFS